MIGGESRSSPCTLLVNLALLAVLPDAGLARSTLPADAGRSSGRPRSQRYGAVAHLAAAPAHAIMMIGTRILFAMGPRRAACRHRERQAAAHGVATLVTTGVAIVLIAAGRSRAGGHGVVLLAENYSVVAPGARRAAPARARTARPFRAWGYPWSASLVLIGAAIF